MERFYTTALTIVWVIYGCILIWLSLRAPTPTVDAPGSDKLNHAIAYAGAMTLTALRFRRQPLWIGLLGVVAFGGLMEVAQGVLTDTREASALDALANTVGATCIAGGFLVWRRRQNAEKA